MNTILLYFICAMSIIIELTLLYNAGYVIFSIILGAILLYAGSIYFVVKHERSKINKGNMETAEQRAPASSEPNKYHKTALFIDADNIDPIMMDHITKNIGLIHESELTFSSVYGNAPALSKWKAIAEKYGMEQKFSESYVVGKNSTDFRIIMDCMDLLHNMNEIDTYVICSSDSDFASIATRLRKEGKTVIGMGSRFAPEIFKNSCSRFIDLSECLWRGDITSRILKMIKKNNGFIASSVAAQEIMKNYNYKDYGYPSFGQMIKDLGFIIDNGYIKQDFGLSLPEVEVIIGN